MSRKETPGEAALKEVKAVGQVRRRAAAPKRAVPPRSSAARVFLEGERNFDNGAFRR